ncbi:16S rRNA (guanine(966)-N(2))-methyltransferase RsmD [Edaphobacillus lindanitolerans]|uniref:16S rRNA (Guanine(966)-N(2))-methyltransferase RsmD n=1 Tax=Edaphobacillus lindanitolerans TaxID=550447 RepID=A0A1U7PHI6_9BACI|nr:16S rRNA (guanine(966)-N(2))-methyltransferase RsmD [Edaphobacillus lindanitolerans]SIT67977.1 16S rRNA (guanine(966)-N(2))-methyltransferase RsmD [Edaphobacillus lindanitolerans]
MRVISGERKGTQLKTATGMGTRPTSDKVKESLFNMIGPYFSGGTVLDLFGGSGGLAIEALSRGMDRAVIVEKDGRALSAIRDNLEKCRYTDRAELHRSDAARAVRALIKKGEAVDLLFLDPPYAKNTYYGLAGELEEAGLIRGDGLIVCEHDKTVDLPERYGSFQKKKEQTYGSTVITIFSRSGEGKDNG